MSDPTIDLNKRVQEAARDGSTRRVLECDLDATIDVLVALQIPLRHDLALKHLEELRDARLELREYASEIIRQMRELGRLERQLTAMRKTIVDIRAAREQAWREGYYTGKRDYAASVMGGAPVSTPNPHTMGAAHV